MCICNHLNCGYKAYTKGLKRNIDNFSYFFLLQYRVPFCLLHFTSYFTSLCSLHFVFVTSLFDHYCTVTTRRSHHRLLNHRHHEWGTFLQCDHRLRGGEQSKRSKRDERLLFYIDRQLIPCKVTIVKAETSNRSEIEVMWMSDSHNYSETMMTLSLLQPQEILIQVLKTNDCIHKYTVP